MSNRCAKCKSWQKDGSDTWCLGCRAWESVGRDLCSRWDGPPAIREVANSLVVNCARELRALRGLGSGLQSSQVVKQEPVETAERGKSVPGLAAKSKAAPEAQAEASEYTDGEEEESEEESEAKAPGVDSRPSLPRCRTPRTEATAAAVSGSAGNSRAPTLADSSRATGVKLEQHRGEHHRRRRAEDPEGSRRREKSRERRREKRKREDRDPKEPAGSKSKGKRPHRRGGRKHQRLSRLATDPYTPHHRKLSEEFLKRREGLP